MWSPLVVVSSKCSVVRTMGECAYVMWPFIDQPVSWTRGQLGNKRPAKGTADHHHMGVDIGAPEGAVIVAPEAGYLHREQGWAGPAAKALIFRADSGRTIVIGAVKPGSHLLYTPLRSPLKAGAPIAQVGRYPGGRTMLHMEIYSGKHGQNQTWPWGGTMPADVLDPDSYLDAVGRVYCEPGEPVRPVLPPIEPEPPTLPPAGPTAPPWTPGTLPRPPAVFALPLPSVLDFPGSLPSSPPDDGRPRLPTGLPTRPPMFPLQHGLPENTYR